MKNTRYVIIRDDDTCALTPIDCLETLYRPFLQAALPVNLAVIPDVRGDVHYPTGPLKGQPEGFLTAAKGIKAGCHPIGSNPKLVRYLRENTGYKIVQHACHHEFVHGAPEFDMHDRAEIARRLEHGSHVLASAGFPRPAAFVAPYDRITRAAYLEIAARFRIISTGWFEWGRLPVRWWPRLLVKKARGAAHFRVNRLVLLSHPGCLLSYHRPLDSMLETVQRTIASRRLTVLVTHWWEFFGSGEPRPGFIRVLHQTAGWLASTPEVKVIAFDDLLDSHAALN